MKGIDRDGPMQLGHLVIPLKGRRYRRIVTLRKVNMELRQDRASVGQNKQKQTNKCGICSVLLFSSSSVNANGINPKAQPSLDHRKGMCTPFYAKATIWTK